MDKNDAAKVLGISVRSLQRLVQAGKISVVHRRGSSGKQEAFFDASELENYKKQRDSESVKPATAITNDTALVRNDATRFLEILKKVVTPDRTSVSVNISEKPLLKIDEAATLTGLSRDVLRTAIKKEQLKAKMIGRAFRIKRTDLDNFIENL